MSPFSYLIAPKGENATSQREHERALARGLLGRLLNCDEVQVAHHEDGAPYLPDFPNMSVSISHCRTAVAVVISEQGKVGIDIESRRPIAPALVARVCNLQEQRLIENTPDPNMAFLKLWTCKEAALKCRGTGIKGFGSLVDALEYDDIKLVDLPTTIADTIATVAILMEA